MSNKAGKKFVWFIVCMIVIVAAALFGGRFLKPRSSDETVREIAPFIGNIQNEISTTGTVLPRNRLEIKPPVNGRIDQILVKEGESVDPGQTVAWMSSTERAALLDAARGQGPDAVKYFEDAYKAIPLISPITGEVIVSTMQPGQTVSTSDAVVVLSDQLIVRAQVDETDIGKVRVGQKAVVSLDAYASQNIKGVVDHIYYESKTVNNVTIYEVDVIPEKIPDYFRSGMNATVYFILQSKENVLLIPLEAVQRTRGETYVLVRRNSSNEPLKQPVQLGLSDDKNVEVVSGITKDDVLVVKSKKFSLPKSSNNGTNPFTPMRRR